GPPLPSPIPCAPSRRDLRSFPTRRSSDLKHFQKTVLGTIVEHLWQIQADTAPFCGSDILYSMERKYRNICFPGRRNTIIHRTYRDRKSTRLNSSHVKIAYAVFCLKKRRRN